MRGSANIHLGEFKLSLASLATHEEGDVMERRHFLKLAVGAAAGAAALAAASAQAAPLSPQPLTGADRLSGTNAGAHPAVTSEAEVEHLNPEQVRWGHHGHHHWGWHHRHWGWHRRHWGWHHRHWGWHHRHWGWHHRHWHRHYW
ncbi:MAG TPA: twin-arginine translocation signal domain-containing protein [Bradyrhizobium sp.]|nr:twin-arginine translocation signal domain-containing protein [Bradyrhizobium sp.]